MGARVTSYFGLDSSKVSFFLHISAVGLVAMFPLAYRFRAFFRRIDLLLWSFGLQLLIALLCIYTQNETLLLLSSLLMGALKIVCILDFLALCIVLFPAMRNRGLLYGIFYAFSRIMQQVSTYITLTLVEKFHWPSVFVLSAIVAVLSIGISLLFFHPNRSQRKVPLYQIDWASVLLITISGVSLCYVLTMGKELNWFASTTIVHLTVLTSLATGLFIYRQSKVKRPFWNLRIFKTYKQVQLGFVVMLVMFFFHQTSTLYNIYLDYNFSHEEHYLAHITFIQIGCYLIAFPLAGYLYYKAYSKRLLLSFGFICYALSLFYFCNSIQHELSYWNLFPPIALGCIAYAFTLVTAAAFMSTNIARKDNKDRAMGSIYARYILGSFIFSSLFSNWVFRGIQHQKVYLSKYISYLNPAFTNQFKQITGAFSTQTTDPHTAQQLALHTMAQKVQLQAMLITLRDITFTVGLLALLTTLIILCIRKLEMHKIKGKNRYKIVPW